VGYSHNAGGFVTRYTRGEILQKAAQKKRAGAWEISESARKCEQKKEFLYTIRAGEEIIKNLQKLTLKKSL
jgi:hypothetical protein